MVVACGGLRSWCVCSCRVFWPVRGNCVGINCVVVEMIGSGMVGCVGSIERSRAVVSLSVGKCWMVWLRPFVLRHWTMGCIWSCLFVLVLLTWAVGGVCRKGPLGDVLRAVHQMVIITITIIYIYIYIYLHIYIYTPKILPNRHLTPTTTNG